MSEVTQVRRIVRQPHDTSGPLLSKNVFAQPVTPSKTKKSMHRTRFRSYHLHYENKQATDSMIRQIDDFPSFFTPTGDQPLILDCGANIGVTALEWKTRWPQSRVICFEPDPFAFALLEKNIEDNDIPQIRCVNAAVADHDGEETLYGQIGRGLDARGNSIDAAWGDREGGESTTVRSVRLSRYFSDQPVSFLKLDIEGAEERVLRDLGPDLERVESAYIEVHQTECSLESNSLSRIEGLLEESGFQIESLSRYDPHALPPQFRRWQQQVGATQTQLLCWR